VSICAAALGLTDKGARIERLKVGNTNRLYKLAFGDKLCLVRVFGTNPALAFDRDTENFVYESLSEQRLVPLLLGKFDGGRIEEWLEGRPASVHECRTDAVSRQVAGQLARLHGFRSPRDLQDARSSAEPWGWATANKWLASAKSAAASESVRKCPEIAERVAALGLERVAVEASGLRERMDGWRLPLVFAHNDLSNTNLHLNSEIGVARLIDFEYGGSNYRGFDLATHLSHWAGGAIDGLYDDSSFPTTEDQMAFLKAYVEAASSCGDAVTIEALRREVNLATPLAHLVWGLWAVCTLPLALAAEPGRFSHIEYAERRLKAFFTSLRRWNSEL